ncbi:MAG: hypothetical protein HXO06_00625 [Prevotella salivae]|uniref:hypothetical protein n=1 Tax=Segatella salivae TaxID=228604 RepID=UPI001CB65292|nr:hypothetical protein [Segatella salivae]MBF1543681.1 hypothetical protein [Segatella salivae]
MAKKVYMKEFVKNITDTVTKSYKQDETKDIKSAKELSAKVVYSDGTAEEFVFNNRSLLDDFDTILTLRDMSNNHKEAAEHDIKKFVKMAYYKANNAIPERINSYEVIGEYIALHEDEIKMCSEALLPTKEYQTVYYKDIKDLIEQVEKL